VAQPRGILDHIDWAADHDDYEEAIAVARQYSSALPDGKLSHLVDCYIERLLEDGFVDEVRWRHCCTVESRRDVPLSRCPSLPLSLSPSLPLSLSPSLPLPLSPSLPVIVLVVIVCPADPCCCHPTVQAARQCQLLLGPTAAVWERWLQRFFDRGDTESRTAFAAVVPTSSPRLAAEAYERVLGHHLVMAPSVYLDAVRMWCGRSTPPDVPVMEVAEGEAPRPPPVTFNPLYDPRRVIQTLEVRGLRARVVGVCACVCGPDVLHR
jgi:hypothetical protein